MIPKYIPLLELTASDVMSRDVIVVPRKMSLRAAAHMLAQAHISGAPVVDDTGRCVGVLSVTDLIHWLSQGDRTAKQRDSDLEPICSDWQVVDLDVVPADEVCHYMTADVVTALNGTPIGELAQKMLDARIHRIIVTDAEGRPIGIVSSTDILAAVAKSNAEANERQVREFHETVAGIH
jgi:CBS-domain-containing membrane protein